MWLYSRKPKSSIIHVKIYTVRMKFPLLYPKLTFGAGFYESASPTKSMKEG
jgi:hypothetical protein